MLAERKSHLDIVPSEVGNDAGHSKVAFIFSVMPHNDHPKLVAHAAECGGPSDARASSLYGPGVTVTARAECARGVRPPGARKLSGDDDFGGLVDPGDGGEFGWGRWSAEPFGMCSVGGGEDLGSFGLEVRGISGSLESALLESSSKRARTFPCTSR